MHTKTFQIKSTSKEILVNLAGSGTVKCQVEIQYNEKPKQTTTYFTTPTARRSSATSVPTSEVDLNFTLYAEDAERKKLQIQLCPSYEGSVDSGMVVVEIAAITGYRFNQTSAEDRSTDEELQKIECNNECKIYFRKIDSGKSAGVKMTLLRIGLTPDPSPRVISVYRSYEPDLKKIFQNSLADIK